MEMLTMSKSLKPGTTISDQISILQSRGMSVDTDLATQWLTNVSYYRLSAYWFPARRIDSLGNEYYCEHSTFTDAVLLYEADRKLRTLIHDGIERIEVTMRTRVGERLCVSGSSPTPVSYQDPTLFRTDFDHTHWVETAKRRVGRARLHNEAIRHYYDEYNQSYPFWVLAEVLDFSDISHLYDGMKSKDQKHIAEDLGIIIDTAQLSKNQIYKIKKRSPLASWLEQLAIIRNSCAHHSRVWNKSFVPVPTPPLKTMPAFKDLPDGQSERIFGAIVVMSFLLRVTSPGTTWPDKVAQLFHSEFLTNPLVDPRSLGIPPDWSGQF